MKIPRYTFIRESLALEIQESDETVDELRNRLKNMRKLMEERRTVDGLDDVRRSRSPGVIDGSFLSVVFGVALVVIIAVSLNAFYSLYSAILKRFPMPHDEL
nr:unnamed protein product [Callosobruchus chinensis]